MKFTGYILLNPRISENGQPRFNDENLAGFFQCADQFLESNRLEEALEGYLDIASRGSELKDPEIQAYLKYIQGICYKRLALQTSVQENLTKAVQVLAESVQLYEKRNIIIKTAIVQNDLGACYTALSEYQEKEILLAKSEAAHESARQLLEKAMRNCNPEQNPLDYIRIMQGLANSYNALAEFKEPEKNLNEAIACCEKALEIKFQNQIPKESVPTIYAVVQYNLGHALKALADINNQEEYKNQALAACQAALQIYELPQFPFEYAHLQNYIANIYIDKAQISKEEIFLNEAIKVCKKVLEVLTAHTRYPLNYAHILYNLGCSCKLYANIRNSREEYLAKALRYFEAILAIDDLAGSSEIFGSTYLNLGILFHSLADLREPSGYLSKAVQCLQDAAKIYTKHEFPAKYAVIQSQLGEVYQTAAKSGSEPVRNLEAAVSAFQEAVGIYETDKGSIGYLQNRHKIGTVWLELAKATQQKEHLQNALQCFKSLQEICNVETHPFEYATSLISLGDTNAFAAKLEDDPTSLSKAMEPYEAALKIYSADLFPVEHGKILTKTGMICRSFANIQNKEGNLNRALNNFQTALKLCPLDKCPLDYAGINEELGYTYLEMAETNPKNYPLAVQSFENVVKTLTPQSHPEKNADIQILLGHCYLNTAGTEGTDIVLQRALRAFEAAVKYYSFEDFPYEFASIMNDIGITYDTFAKTVKGISFQSPSTYQKFVAEKIFNAVGAYEAALSVFTFDSYPKDYAQVQHNLGLSYSFLAGVQGKNENANKAIRAFQEALRVYTPEGHPVLYRQVNTQLEKEKQRLN